MSEKYPTLEIIAPSVEEAINKGLADLGIPRDAVEVEVLDEGTKGFLGIGNRDARIRLTVVNSMAEPPADVLEESTPVPASEPASRRSPAGTPQEGTLLTARETVLELLEKMGVRADVVASYGEAEEDGESIPILVDIYGEDLSILIGSRAATLDALQYITRLIVSKELGRSALVIIDVEGYRERRKRQLQRLARKMAEQAVTTGRRQVLEPMPANERRIIHIELRDHPEVKTESIGEEPRRKVTISPRL